MFAMRSQASSKLAGKMTHIARGTCGQPGGVTHGILYLHCSSGP